MMRTDDFLKELNLEIRKLDLKEKLTDDPRKKAEIKQHKNSKSKLRDFVQKRWCSRSVETATLM